MEAPNAFASSSSVLLALTTAVDGFNCIILSGQREGEREKERPRDQHNSGSEGKGNIKIRSSQSLRKMTNNLYPVCSSGTLLRSVVV